MNTGGKIGIGIGSIIGIIVVIFIFTNIDDLFSNEIEEFASKGGFTSSVYPNKINDECELVNFLNSPENMSEVMSFVMSNESQFTEKYYALGGDQTSSTDLQSIINKNEIGKIVFADIIIEEFSVNPDLKNFLIVIQDGSSQNLIERMNKIDPNCEIGEGLLNQDFGQREDPLLPENIGPLGSDHAHAGILVKIFGDTFDFDGAAYQIKSSWIHFEGNDGTTIHKHATGVTLGYLFDTLGLGLDDQCFVFKEGKSLCTTEDYSMKFFINDEPIDDIRDYEITEDDKILVSYGAETTEEIESQLLELETRQLLK